MTISASLLLDLVLILLLLYWTIMGVRRGFVLTLCSLLAIFLALAGGWYLSQNHYAPVQESLEPVLTEHFRDSIQEELSQAAPNSGSLDISRFSLPPQIDQAIRSHLGQSAETIQDASAAALGSACAALAAKAILFLLGFFGVLLLWTILSHVLNLVTRLPVLHFFNKVLGGVLGFGKGVLLLMVARWVLCDLLAWIPPEVTEESYLLPWLPTLSIFSGPAG